MADAFVIGTAGHVDHGKTSLVRALTGVDTDRLPEEKARGISLELGFAPLVLAEGLGGSVIDVPGHERLVRAMIRGAASIDAVLLVVAANEGVMPQTREHLAICELLGARRLVVALTKIDLLDDEDARALAAVEVDRLLVGTVFEGSAIVPCSSKTGLGLDELRAALGAAVGETCHAKQRGPAFLPVDRAFAKAGFGTIVTGTLLRGALAIGDEVDVLTARGVERSRVRGLQSHGRAVPNVAGRTRIAVSLAATAEPALRSGALGARGTLRPTTQLVVTLRGLPGVAARDPLPRRGRLTIHLGVEAAEASFSLLDAAPAPGEAGAVQRAFLTLSRPLLAWTDDRFIVRHDTPRGLQTFGGGSVLDPHPVRSRRRLRHAAPALDETTAARVERIVDEAGAEGCTRDDLEARAVPGEHLDEALAAHALTVAADVPRLVGHGAMERIERSLLERVVTLHREHPSLAAHPIATVIAAAANPAAATVALGRLVERGALSRRDGRIAEASRVADDATEALLFALEETFRSAGLTPPTDEAAIAKLPHAPPRAADLFAELRRRRVLVRVPPFHVHAVATDGLVAQVREFFEGHASLGAADLKMLGGGLSRKYAIPLLEWLDARGTTRRVGERHLPNALPPKLSR